MYINKYMVYKQCCSNVSDTQDIVAMWFELENSNIWLEAPMMFDLQVGVDLQGVSSAGRIEFESKLYLSLDDTWEDSDTEVIIPRIYIYI